MMILYHLVFEFHWRPRDVFNMEEWELALVWSLMQHHQKMMNKD